MASAIFSIVQIAEQATAYAKDIWSSKEILFLKIFLTIVRNIFTEELRQNAEENYLINNSCAYSNVFQHTDDGLDV